MASLRILKTPGATQETTFPLDGDRFVIGRNPDCGIVIPVTSVSREHAQIVRVQGRFHIEDMQSRNGTFVNNQAISARVPLKNNDRIRICDFLAVFVDPSRNEPPTVDEPDDPRPRRPSRRPCRTTAGRSWSCSRPRSCAASWRSAPV